MGGARSARHSVSHAPSQGAHEGRQHFASSKGSGLSFADVPEWTGVDHLELLASAIYPVYELLCGACVSTISDAIEPWLMIATSETPPIMLPSNVGAKKTSR